MTTRKPVVVKEFPKSCDEKNCSAFLRELEPHFESERPYLVFDLSEVRSLDSAGVDLLLLCMEEAIKRNGDLKLATVSPELAAILEMTRVDRLFEIFESTTEAVESFHRLAGSSGEPMADRAEPPAASGRVAWETE